MTAPVRALDALLDRGEALPPAEWQLRAIQSDDCLSYVAWNERSREALVVDPKAEDLEHYRKIARELQGYLWLGVIDTHTHADHVSSAAALADELKTSLIMHAQAPSHRVHLRVSKVTKLPSHSAPLELVPTPGHTGDSITVLWGPFIFGGDTVLYGDSGRDDLPGGEAEAHYESLQFLKKLASPKQLLLPGHDHKGGRASSWARQLEINASLTQGREDFVRESNAFDAPAPALLKKSLRENFR